MKATFNDPQDIQALNGEEYKLNQRICTDDHISSLNEPNSYQDQAHTTKYDAFTPKTNSVHPDNCKQHVERPNLSQIPLEQETGRSINEVKNMTKTNITNSEDQFNKSLITLVNSQQGLQKQLLNMMKDMTHRHEYDNS